MASHFKQPSHMEQPAKSTTFSVRVRVKADLSESLVLPLQPTDTVSTMMQSIEQHTKIPVQSQRLIHNGRQLEGTQVVSQLVSASSTMLSLVLLHSADMRASVRLCVRTINNRNMVFDIGVQCTLRNVKQLVEFTYGLKVMDSTVVFFGDAVLDDSKTLFDYGLLQASTLYILPVVQLTPEEAQLDPPGDTVSIEAARRSVYLSMVQSLGPAEGPPLSAASRVGQGTELVDDTDRKPAPAPLDPGTASVAKKRKRGMEMGFSKGFLDRPRSQKHHKTTKAVQAVAEGLKPIPVSVAVDLKAVPAAPTVSKVKKGKRRCELAGCKEKLTLTSITCRCLQTFCAEHRHAEAHWCPVDYKEIHKQMLAKNMVSALPQRVAAL